MVRQPSLVSVLREMSQEANTDPFLSPFLTILAKRALKEASGSAGKGFSTTGESSNAEDDDDAPTIAPPLMSMLVEILGTISLNRSIVMEMAR